jgi:hypothetical protein
LVVVWSTDDAVLTKKQKKKLLKQTGELIKERNALAEENKALVGRENALMEAVCINFVRITMCLYVCWVVID